MVEDQPDENRLALLCPQHRQLSGPGGKRGPIMKTYKNAGADLSAQTRQLLENYSDIPPEEQSEHVHKIV